mmetsp:Transcript_10660/g.22795  ORF Transcript_10660/g.22795 Transcript_10660/m.22795 type:complete len:133 (-) Transcript_10660:37-435(-)
MITDLIVNFPDQGRRNRTVSFNEYSKMSVVENITIRYKDAVWLSKDEINEIRYKFKTSLRKVMSAPGCGMEKYQLLKDNDSICLIGAENFITPSMTARVTKHRQDHTKKVLIEQERQHRRGVIDPIELCSVS